MLTLLTAEKADGAQELAALFQLLHSGEVENPWSAPLLEAVCHCYCTGRQVYLPAACQDPPMELYLWYADPGALAAMGQAGLFSTGSNAGAAPGENRVEAVENAASFPYPLAALALTGDCLTLCAPPEHLPFLDRRELEQFAAVRQVGRIECGGEAARWLSAGAAPGGATEFPTASAGATASKDMGERSAPADWAERADGMERAALTDPAGLARPADLSGLVSLEGPSERLLFARRSSDRRRKDGRRKDGGRRDGRVLERRPAMVWTGAPAPFPVRSLSEGASLSGQPGLDGVHALLTLAYPGFSVPRDFWIYDTSRRIRRGCAQILAVEDPHGRILSTAGCYAAGKQAALISGVATHPDARRRGYGSALVAQLASLLSADGKTVWIIPVDSYAQALYASIGFTVCGNYHCIYEIERQSSAGRPPY